MSKVIIYWCASGYIYYTMRTAATILVLVLLMSIQTPVGQLFKFPLLIEHFVKHQKQDGVSLFGFLVDHYTDGHKDADLPEDEQLPFKSIILYSIGYAVVPSVVQTHISVALPADQKVICLDSYVPQQHIASIFHPPRV